MAIALSDLRRVRGDGPPRILIYGTPGIGKTTLASEFPNPVFLQCEDGAPTDVELVSFGRLETYAAVAQAMRSLYDEPHEFQTVVVDSVTALQTMVFAETCAHGDDKGNAKNNIEDFGYGKGYVYALRVWEEFVNGLNVLRRDRNMTILLLAHSKIERFDDPETVSYDRYEIDMHAKSVGLIEREMDAIFLLKQDVTIKSEDQGFNKARAVGQGGNTVWIHAKGKPAFVAKNRYSIPEKIVYTKGQGFAALAPYLPVIGTQNISAQNIGAQNISTQTIEPETKTKTTKPKAAK